MKYVCAIILIAVVALTGSAVAAPGTWYNPDRDGHGVQINRDSGFGHGVTWYLYRPDGTTSFLVAKEPCLGFPCVAELVEPTAGFMGGNLDLGETVGILEIGVAEGNALSVRYELSAWLLDQCDGLTPGGLIFRKCVGQIDMELLAE